MVDTIEFLIQKATIHLDSLGYTAGTKMNYKSCWNQFKKYSKLRGVKDFSLDFGYEFLSDYYGIDSDSRLSQAKRSKVRYIKCLAEIAKTGKFKKCYQLPGEQLPECFSEVFNHFILKKQEEKLKARTIQTKSIILIRFLKYVESLEIEAISSVQVHHVIDFFKTIDEYAKTTKSTNLYVMRDFFNFLALNGYNENHLNQLFPLIRSNKFERLPSFYTPEEIKSILSKVDRTCEIGRRDYAILILAIQLGIRAGDIRKLKISDIKWHLDKIEFIQEKTENPLQLPLPENVKYAILDYLKNSRPKTDNPHVFIRHRAPFDCFMKGNVFFDVINKYLKMAGIEVKNRKHGLHSMRHSLASNLLQEDTPLPIITGVLGHENSNTTKLYLRIDIEQLRSVGLEVPINDQQ